MKDQLHSGEIHRVEGGKVALARHLSEPHQLGDRIRSITFPRTSELARWRKDELENAHREMHE